MDQASPVVRMETRLSVHEAVCAERYGSLIARMSRLEKAIISAAVTLIGIFAWLSWKLFALLAKLPELAS